MIIPRYHVIPATYPVGTTDIYPGYTVMVNSSGLIVPNTNAATQRPLGLAADKQASVGTFDPRTSFSNRVSDYGDETSASGQIGVYESGGQFYVDVDTASIYGVITTGSTTTPGTLLYQSATTGQLSSTARSNSDDADVPTAVIIDDLSATSGLLPTGIPNEYEPAGDSDTSRTFVLIKLLV